MKINDYITKRANERYPEYLDERDSSIDHNRPMREAYIRALKEVFTPQNMWDIFEIGKEVVNELNGSETTTEYFGRKMLERL